MKIAAGRRTIATSPNDFLEGSPYLWVYVLPDQATESVFSLVQQWADDLDEATGNEIHLDVSGHPAMSGRYYQDARDPCLIKRDAADGVTYQQSIAALGGMSGAQILHRLRNTRTIATELQLSHDQLPCLAFCTRPDLLPPTILPLRAEWFDTASSGRAFMETLVGWFSGKEYRSAIPKGATVGFVHKKLRTLLSHLEQQIDRAVERAQYAATGSDRRRRKTEILVQLRLEELPSGSRVWGNCCARLVGEHRFAGLLRNIGVRQLCFFHLLMTSKREEEIGGRFCLVFTEDEGVRMLKNWSHAGKIIIQGSDAENPAARLRKNWHEFKRQMEKDQTLRGLFVSRGDRHHGGERLYGIKLRKGEVQVLIADISSVL